MGAKVSPTTCLMREPLSPTMETPAMTVASESHLGACEWEAVQKGGKGDGTDRGAVYA